METIIIPLYGYQDGQWVQVKINPADPESDEWRVVWIKSRTFVFDLGPRKVPVYTVEDRDGTTWLVGEWEMKAY